MDEKDSLCQKCGNIINVDYDSMGGVYTCIFVPSLVRTNQVRRCNKFEEKEDTKDKPKQSAKLSVSCVQPSNHGRKGTMPRSRKGGFKGKGVNVG